MTRTVYTIDVATLGDDEAVVAEYLHDEAGNELGHRYHTPDFDVTDATYTSQQCFVPFEVGSIGHVHLTPTGIVVAGEEYDLELVG